MDRCKLYKSTICTYKSDQLRQISTPYSLYNCDGKILSTYVYFPEDEIYINDDACFIHFLTDKEIYIEVSS